MSSKILRAISYIALAVTLTMISACHRVTTDHATSPTPFKSDNCSLSPDGLIIHKKNLWSHCCVEHDLYYWMGGSRSNRAHADQLLDRCITDTGHPIIAKRYRIGVKLAGSPYHDTTYRWGYGWPYTKGYFELNDANLFLLKRNQRQIRGLKDGNCTDS